MANTTHLDRRRRRRPRDYLADPYAFGVRSDARLVLPADGDRVSMQIAARQHWLVLTWRGRGRQPRSGVLCARWGFSSSTFSRIVTGERWAGETGLAALEDALHPSPRTPIVWAS